MPERNISENNQFYLFLGQNPESPNGIFPNTIILGQNPKYPNGIFPNIIIFGIKSKIPERNISESLVTN